MSRAHLLAALALGGLLSAGCFSVDDDAPPPPPSAPSRPPRLEPLRVPDWPPLGARSRIDTSCSDDVGVRRIVAHFRFSALVSATGADASASFSGADLGEGQGLLRVVCCDVAEACAERQISNLLVDLTPPEIDAERLVASPLVDGGDGEIAVWIRDAWVLGSVELSFAGTTLLRELPKVYPSTVGTDWDVSRVTFPAKELPRGAGRAVVTARDAAGNTATKDLDLRIDGTRPAVSILAPASAAVVDGSSFVVRLAASDSDNPTPPRITLWVGGARVADLEGPLAEIAVDTATLSPGPTEVRAVARDDAGNESVAARVVVVVE
ncbi:MAG: hypothetical protein KF850_22530 [Labilithrix sp.]|nr:hypothetical protein [Labilithrix sp.]MBX3214827.1 hypothetical protein [Labilithrix sp.]